MYNICEHQQLKRQCMICTLTDEIHDRDQEIERLRIALEAVDDLGYSLDSDNDYENLVNYHKEIQSITQKALRNR